MRNDLRHGFNNILITDLRDPILRQALRRFARQRYRLIPLYTCEDAVLKARVLDETRSSGYRDWEEALALNRLYITRPLHPREVRIDVTHRSVQAVMQQTLPFAVRSG